MIGPGLKGFAAIGAVAALAAVGQGAGGQVTPAPTPAADADPATQGTPAPAACLKRFAVVGLPYDRAGDADLPENLPRKLLCHGPYAVSYNPLTRNPDWVIEYLTPAVLKGPANRDHSRFTVDPALTVKDRPVRASDYHGAYDRGHQAPAGDAKASQPLMNQTFYMTNMAPQVGVGFNRGQWRYLEEDIRAWVLCGGHARLIVITGPIYTRGDPLIAGSNIRVPKRFFKVLYDLDSERAVGFELDNQAYEKTDIANFIVPISKIEDDTGLDFFHAFSRRRQTQLETPKGLAWGHDSACTGAQTD